jgi:DNA adenine methylase
MNIPGQVSSFNYLGGKYSVLPWLLPLLQVPHKHFVDVCGGSGVVLMNMPQAPIETYNDINSIVVNFFRVLQKHPEELISELQLTLHSRQEYMEAWYDAADSPLEQAKKFFIRTTQSLWAAGAQDKMKGWAMSVKETRVNLSEKTHKWLGAVQYLPEIVKRFKQVQIENKDFRYIFKNYDSPETLFYFDGPYHDELRSSTKYTFDFIGQDFLDLQYWSKRIKGKLAISGYHSDKMNELFSHLHCHEGPRRKNNRSDKNANECLWTNYQ